MIYWKFSFLTPPSPPPSFIFIWHLQALYLEGRTNIGISILWSGHPNMENAILFLTHLLVASNFDEWHNIFIRVATGAYSGSGNKLRRKYAYFLKNQRFGLTRKSTELAFRINCWKCENTRISFGAPNLTKYLKYKHFKHFFETFLGPLLSLAPLKRL